MSVDNELGWLESDSSFNSPINSPLNSFLPYPSSEDPCPSYVAMYPPVPSPQKGMATAEDLLQQDSSQTLSIWKGGEVPCGFRVLYLPVLVPNKSDHNQQLAELALPPSPRSFSQNQYRLQGQQPPRPPTAITDGPPSQLPGLMLDLDFEALHRTGESSIETVDSGSFCLSFCTSSTSTPHSNTSFPDALIPDIFLDTLSSEHQ